MIIKYRVVVVQMFSLKSLFTAVQFCSVFISEPRPAAEVFSII